MSETNYEKDTGMNKEKYIKVLKQAYDAGYESGGSIDGRWECDWGDFDEWYAEAKKGRLIKGFWDYVLSLRGVNKTRSGVFMSILRILENYEIEGERCVKYPTPLARDLTDMLYSDTEPIIIPRVPPEDREIIGEGVPPLKEGLEKSNVKRNPPTRKTAPPPPPPRHHRLYQPDNKVATSNPPKETGT